MNDLQGRRYAELRSLHEGDRVTVDEGFTCLGKGVIRIVKVSNKEKYISCSQGKHFLDGQLKGHALIGVYKS